MTDYYTSSIQSYLEYWVELDLDDWENRDDGWVPGYITDNSVSGLRDWAEQEVRGCIQIDDRSDSFMTAIFNTVNWNRLFEYAKTYWSEIHRAPDNETRYTVDQVLPPVNQS